MDMGWQKRSRGRKYDSNSRHAFSIALTNRKPVGMCLRNKYCRICSIWQTKQKEAPVHNCKRIHIGSSGSMESSALIEMVEWLFFEKFCIVEYVVTDDDSKMKAHTKWSNADWARHFNLPVPGDKDRSSGMLRYPCYQPDFLADLAHRKKTLRNHI